MKELHIDFAIYNLPCGCLRIDYDIDINAVVSLKIMRESHPEAGHATALTDEVAAQLTEYFAGQRQTFDFTYRMTGTEFQQKVWKAISDIPYGETRSYKEIAEAIGSPKACRAVGMANNKNPIPIVVPCHRVIGSNGALVGYAYGLEMKQRLLELEYTNKNPVKSI